MSFRTWIVPAPADVYTKGDSLNIVSAPLSVEMETQYITLHGSQAAGNYPHQAKSVEDHNEAVFRRLFLPRIEKEVTTGPEYAALRQVYFSRVAAEWYRQLSEKKHTTYRQIIDKGDVAPWRTQTGWKSLDTFHQYVTSYTKGEFKVTRHTRTEDYIYTHTYIFGGVDFTRVLFRTLSPHEVNQQAPGMAKNLTASLANPVLDKKVGVAWLRGGRPSDTGKAVSRSLANRWKDLPLAARLALIAGGLPLIFSGGRLLRLVRGRSK